MEVEYKVSQNRADELEESLKKILLRQTATLL